MLIEFLDEIYIEPLTDHILCESVTIFDNWFMVEGITNNSDSFWVLPNGQLTLDKKNYNYNGNAFLYKENNSKQPFCRLVFYEGILQQIEML